MSKIVSHVIIVGVGLLGSSIGLAVKKRGLADTVIGIDRCRETLDTALRREAVDAVATEPGVLTEINEGLVVICTPVRAIVDSVERITALNGNLLISDVGSTKANICYELEQRGVRFVGAHPIAGSEKGGPEFGDEDLFQNRLTVLTPTTSSRSEDIERLQRFWESLGSRVLQLTPEQHDAILAKTSHLPHAVAATLASLVTEEDLPFCGTGFADTTRIASGPPVVWTDIFLDNRLQLLAMLEVFGDRLESLKTALEASDSAAVTRFLESARKNINR
jgi:prephenate dehydrogenase